MSTNARLSSEQRDAVRKIIEEEAHAALITVDDLLKKSRRSAVVNARLRAMCRARNETKLSYPQIAFVFERDHTSILNAVRRLQANSDDADIVN